MSLIKHYLEEKLKGNQHKLDKNKNEKIDADDFKKLQSEDEDEKSVDAIATSDFKSDKNGKKYKAHKIVFKNGEDDGKNNMAEAASCKTEEMSDDQMKKREDYVKGMKKNYKSFVDKYGKDRAKNVMYATATKMAMKEEQVEEGWDDMKTMAKKAIEKQKTSTLTKHDVKKTDTGTVYTKQRDPDGMSKEFKRDNSEVKRGRGRPKKNQFAEALEFLMDLTEEQFDQVVEEGLDSFVESYIDEGKKGYAPGWMIQASPELKKKLDDKKAKQKAMKASLGNPNAGKPASNK
jgi:hypothetical protein